MHQEYGMATFAVIVILAGVLQTIAGIFKVGIFRRDQADLSMVV